MMQTASAFSSVQGALSFFISIYRQLAEWQAVVNRLDGFEAGIARGARTCNPQRQDSRRRGGGRRRDRPQGIGAATAERHAAGQRRAIQFAQGRAHADDGPLGVRQIDAVPRHCRHLAVRGGLNHRPCGGNIDDAAAAAVLPDRIAARGGRISRQGGHLHRPPDQQRAGAGRIAQARVADPANMGTGTGRCRSASSSASGSHARCCMRRNICSSTKPPPRSTNLRRRRCIACSRRNCRQPPSSRSAIARRSTPSTSAMSGSPATAIDSCCRTAVRA